MNTKTTPYYGNFQWQDFTELTGAKFIEFYSFRYRWDAAMAYGYYGA